MSKKHLLLTALAMAALSASALADDVPVVTIEPLKGDSYSVAIEKVASVSFADNKVSLIAKADGSVIYSKPIVETSRVTFGLGSPSSALRNVEASSSDVAIVAEPSKRSVRVLGLPDGSPVLVYSLAGALQVRGAAPSVSLGGLPAGLYIVVAGNAAAKVTVK